MKTGNKKAGILAETLDKATGKLLATGKSPSRKAGELDNRGSHFYLALYWAQALAEQKEDAQLQSEFTSLAKALAANEDKIIEELSTCQGQPVDMQGYFLPDTDIVEKLMRPSETLNSLIKS